MFFKLQVENLVAIELAYINTKHPDFHKDAALVSSLLKSVEEEDMFKQQTRISKRHTVNLAPSNITTAVMNDTDHQVILVNRNLLSEM